MQGSPSCAGFLSILRAKIPHPELADKVGRGRNSSDVAASHSGHGAAANDSFGTASALYLD